MKIISKRFAFVKTFFLLSQNVFALQYDTRGRPLFEVVPVGGLYAGVEQPLRQRKLQPDALRPTRGVRQLGNKLEKNARG